MKKFLIADDSVFMRSSIKRLLIKHGYAIAGEAENGRIATEKYKELRPDAVTMDITMQEMSGLEALAEIMKYDPNAKVIMVSAMGQEAIILESIRLGAKNFLTKPFKEHVVLAAVKGLWEK